MVEPFIHLGTNIKFDTQAWKFLFQSGEFASDFVIMEFSDFSQWNVDAASQLLDSYLNELGGVEFADDDLPLWYERLAVACLLEYGIDIVKDLEAAFLTKPEIDDLAVSYLATALILYSF